MTKRRQSERRSSVYKSALLMTAFLMIASGLFAPSVVAQSQELEAISIISSRFLLWDDSEKMLDDSFQIHLIELNQSDNSSVYYEINIDGNQTFGIFDNYLVLNFTTEASQIMLIEVLANNETILTARDIKIMGGMSGSGISAPSSPFKLSLSPWEWSQKEWNIVGSIVLSSLLALAIGYRVAKRYRKLHGVKEVR